MIKASLFVSFAAAWLLSALLNWIYVPWNSIGFLPYFFGACLGTIIAFAMISHSLARTDSTNPRSFFMYFLLTVCVLTIGELAYWAAVSENNNKPMIFRQIYGAPIGAALLLPAFIYYRILARSKSASWSLSDCLRWLAWNSAVTIPLELVLICVRPTSDSYRLYHAIDSSMFSIALLSVLLAISIVYQRLRGLF